MFLVVITNGEGRMIHSGAERSMIGTVFASLQDMTAEYNESFNEEED